MADGGVQQPQMVPRYLIGIVLIVGGATIIAWPTRLLHDYTALFIGYPIFGAGLYVLGTALRKSARTVWRILGTVVLGIGALLAFLGLAGLAIFMWGM